MSDLDTNYARTRITLTEPEVEMTTIAVKKLLSEHFGYNAEQRAALSTAWGELKAAMKRIKQSKPPEDNE
jgi:hypothetical protein